MSLQRMLLAMSGAALMAVPYLSADEPEQASIAFATTSGIESWHPVGNDTLYIKSRDDQWYKADLLGPCMGLGFDPTIGFVVRSGSSFDRSSSILIEGRECKLSSLVKVTGPPTRTAQTDASLRASRTRQPGAAQREETKPDAKPQRQSASIPFASLGSIRDWRAVSDEVLYVKGLGDQWYRATLFAPCWGLKFEDTIGFVVEPSGSFDKFSSIVVDGRECHLATLTKAQGPPGSRQAATE